MKGSATALLNHGTKSGKGRERGVGGRNQSCSSPKSQGSGGICSQSHLIPQHFGPPSQASSEPPGFGMLNPPPDTAPGEPGPGAGDFGRAAPHSSEAEGDTGIWREQHQRGGHGITHTRIATGMQGPGTAPPPPSSPPSPAGNGTIPRESLAGREGDMHTDPALLPRAGKGGEEEEEKGLQQHLSSSGWSRRLGRRTGTPLVLGISGIT